MRPMTATAERLPLPSAGPIECQPWCLFGDGHGDAFARDDQRCYTDDLRVDMTLRPMLEEGRLVEGEGWVRGPDHVLVHASQLGHERQPRISIRQETDGPFVELEFTPGEARELIEAVQLVLGQIGGGLTSRTPQSER